MTERLIDYYYTIDEVRGRLGALKETDVKQLRAMADVWARGVRHYDGADFLQTMLERMASGSRQWPRDMPLHVALDEDFRSLRSQYLDHEQLERDHNAETLTATEAFGVGGGDAHEALAGRHVDQDTPLELLCADEVIPAIENLFSDNDTAQLIIMAWSEDKKKAEIIRDLGISETEYDSTVRLIHRRMAKLGD